jgi:hypothetical protein
MLSRVDVANDGAETDFLSHLGAAYDAMALSSLKSSQFPHTTGLLKAFTFLWQTCRRRTAFTFIRRKLPSGRKTNFNELPSGANSRRDEKSYRLRHVGCE